MKWNEDKTEAILTKDEYDELKEAPTKLYNKGFGEGKTKGQDEVLKHFDFLELDKNNLADSVGKMKTMLTDIQQGKIPEALKGKIQETDLVKNLQDTITKKDAILTEKEKAFDAFKRETLIDNKIIALSTNETGGNVALNKDQVKMLFKASYNLELDDKNQVVVKTPDGNVLLDEKANPKTLDIIFGEWAKTNPHLFKGNNKGGSGGSGSDKGPSGIKLSDLKTQKEIDVFIKTYGIKVYKEMLEADFKSQTL